MSSSRWTCLCITLILFSVAACDGAENITSSSSSSSSADTLQPFENQAFNDEYDQWVVASGTLQPVGEVEVGSEVSGRIAEVLVDFNDVVRKNQIIARIAPKSFEAQLRQAEAALLDARATAEVQKASLLQARRSLKRIENLKKKQAVSQDILDDAETAVQISFAELNRSQAVVTNREAALEEAKVALSRTEIRSPIDGVVISREVMSGQTVAASMEAPRLFKIAKTLSEMEIHARIDEADIGQIHVQQQATFTVPAHGDKPFEARVTQVRVAPVIVDNVVTYTVVLLAGNNDKSLLPGMTAVVEIAIGEFGTSAISVDAK